MGESSREPRINVEAKRRGRADSLYRFQVHQGLPFTRDRPPRGRSNVGHPVGVNPDRELAADARAEG